MVLIDHSASPKPLFGKFRFWQIGASVYTKPYGMWSMLEEKTFQRCLLLNDLGKGKLSKRLGVPYHGSGKPIATTVRYDRPGKANPIHASFAVELR
jgi:hypothetical protein